MKRRRRCKICQQLFMPDPRVGARQGACGAVDCQRERHRLACAAWREREAPAVREYRLRRRLGCPEGSLKLDVVRDECGAKVKVVIEETLRLVLFGMRDECSSIVLDKRQQVLRLTPAMARDETAPARASP